MNDIAFSLDVSGGAYILRSNQKLASIELGAMESLLGHITASFMQTFGVEGNFEVIGYTTDRLSVKISAADAKTSAILKRNPKWLNQFVDNIHI